MNFRERLGHWLLGSSAGQQHFERVGMDPLPLVPTSNARFGPGIGNQPSHEALLRESLGVADFATRALRNRVAMLNPLVKITRRIEEGTEKDEVLDDHRLKKLLDDPHPNFTRSQLLGLTTQYLVTVGEAYWLKIGNKLNVPVRLDPLLPSRVRPIIDRDLIDGYVIVDADGNEVLAPQESMVRFWFPDPENIFGSEGYLGPNAIATDTQKFQGEHLRKMYEDNAIPPAFVRALDTAEQPEPATQKKWEYEWRQKYHQRAGEISGMPAWLPPGFDIIFSKLQTGAEISPLLEYFTRLQLMNFGVPRSVLGEVVSGDRSSAETNQFVMDLHAISPLAVCIEQALTRQLAVDFDERIFIEFDEFVARDKDYVLKRELQDLETKVRSINQVREDREEDPVEWGDKPVGSMADVPYTGEELDLFDEPEDPGALEEGDEGPETEEPDVEEEEEEEEERCRTFESLDQTWQRVMLYERLYGAEMMMRMRQIFVRQRARALARLRESEPRARIRVDNLFDPEEWVGEFDRRILPVFAQVIQRGGQDALAATGTSESFLFGDLQLSRTKGQTMRLVTRTGRTTRRRLERTIAKGVEAGESIDDLASRVSQVFDRRKRDARTIARTEVLQAHQAAQVEGFRQSGVVRMKQWNAARDERVRDSHRIDGTQKPLNEDFELMATPEGRVEFAQNPGDPRLSPENTINCFLPGTGVRGVFEGGLQAWYSGQTVKIRTISGRSLEITWNHPVLTEKGWLPANKLSKSDNLVCYGHSLKPGSRFSGISKGRNEQNHPAAVNQVFDLLADLGSTHVSRAASEDLYGDGQFTEGQVKIVRARGELLGNLEAAFSQTIGQIILEKSDSKQTLLEGFRSLYLTFQRISTSPTSLPSFSELLFHQPAIAAELGPLQSIRVGSAAYLDIRLPERVSESNSTDPSFSTELQKRYPGLISLDEIVEVGQGHWFGHVYDLQAEDGWIIANGIFCSNCRCFLSPVLVGSEGE